MQSFRLPNRGPRPAPHPLERLRRNGRDEVPNYPCGADERAAALVNYFALRIDVNTSLSNSLHLL